MNRVKRRFTMRPEPVTTGRADCFLQSGADVNARDDAQHAPLHLSAFDGNWDTCSALIAHGADVNALDDFNRSALHAAVKQGFDGICLELLAHGAATVSLAGCTSEGIVQMMGCTRLQLAVELGEVEPVMATILADTQPETLTERLMEAVQSIEGQDCPELAMVLHAMLNARAAQAAVLEINRHQPLRP